MIRSFGFSITGLMADHWQNCCRGYSLSISGQQSFALQEENKVIGFLAGFVSQTDPTQAYVHFVAIHPDHRRRGLGRQLYTAFFETVQRLGCATARCITSPVNTGSVAFHTRMGFQIEGVTGEHQGVPCTLNHELNRQHRVLFMRRLS